MKLLKGMEVVSFMNEAMKKEISLLDYTPQLAIVRIGERPDDISYERGAVKRMETIGLGHQLFSYPETITFEEFKKEFEKINHNKEIDGILLLRPLPKHIKEEEIATMISPEKDVDGISPMNMAKVFSGDHTGFAPCTPQAVIEMLHHANISLVGKKVAIVGRSLVVGKPLAMLLVKEHATVTICHTKTEEIEKECKQADIIIAAAGKAKMLTSEYVKDGAIVIDVGINVDENNKLCGDVDFENVQDVVSVITPVPGGVGTVTTSVLAKNVIQAAKKRREHIDEMR